MIDKEILDVLVCPEDRTPLHVADEDLLARLNTAIAAGKVENRGAAKVEAAVQGGLVRQDGKLLYPIVDDIPVLLVEEAISLEQIDG
ncbi:MAG: hypothetical protein HQ567_13660 [Candidatus Nealsonbacteria bacterium]|nr:hypothetical protein [Candidatus Nealsonbacteria bacterium]